MVVAGELKVVDCSLTPDFDCTWSLGEGLEEEGLVVFEDEEEEVVVVSLALGEVAAAAFEGSCSMSSTEKLSLAELFDCCLGEVVD